MNPAVLVVFCTVPTPEKGKEIGSTLVTERLCACVNVVKDLESIYWWQAKVTNDPEALMILKTTVARYDALEERLLALHPYSVPEILALPVMNGAEKYLEWVNSETQQEC